MRYFMQKYPILNSPIHSNQTAERSKLCFKSSSHELFIIGSLTVFAKDEKGITSWAWIAAEPVSNIAQCRMNGLVDKICDRKLPLGGENREQCGQFVFTMQQNCVFLHEFLSKSTKIATSKWFLIVNCFSTCSTLIHFVSISLWI